MNPITDRVLHVDAVLSRVTPALALNWCRRVDWKRLLNILSGGKSLHVGS